MFYGQNETFAGFNMQWTKTEKLLWRANELHTQTYYVRDKFILQCFVCLACSSKKNRANSHNLSFYKLHQKVTKSRNKPQRLQTTDFSGLFRKKMLGFWTLAMLVWSVAKSETVSQSLILKVSMKLNLTLCTYLIHISVSYSSMQL